VRREVILSGGAVNSPQLLMLSGVGPAEHLAERGIPVVHDMPGVGRNLQDHLQTRIALRCSQPITVNDIMRSPFRKLRAGLEYAIRRTGPLATAAAHVGLFLRTRPEVATPDVQMHFSLFSADRPAAGLHLFSGFTINACQLRPESRGTISLRSADPAATPAICPNYLSTELDRRTLVDGLKICRDLLAQPAMRAFIAGEYLPGPSVCTDEDWLDYVRNYASTIFHPCGTCKMGVDAMAVVDPGLRVRGIAGLRVADASIMPTVISGNTNAAAIMIGEKAADLVRGAQLAAVAEVCRPA
jgi:choline dehydrogenase